MTTIFAPTLFLFLFPFVVYANLRGATSDPHMRMLNVMRRANGMDSASTPGQGGAGADHSMAAGLTRSAAEKYTRYHRQSKSNAFYGTISGP